MDHEIYNVRNERIRKIYKCVREKERINSKKKNRMTKFYRMRKREYHASIGVCVCVWCGCVCGYESNLCAINQKQTFCLLICMFTKQTENALIIEERS